MLTEFDKIELRGGWVVKKKLMLTEKKKAKTNENTTNESLDRMSRNPLHQKGVSSEKMVYLFHESLELYS